MRKQPPTAASADASVHAVALVRGPVIRAPGPSPKRSPALVGALKGERSSGKSRRLLRVAISWLGSLGCRPGGFLGFLSRLLIPRSVRRATHPVRTARRAVTPRPVKKVQRAMHPLDSAVYSVERSISTSIRNGSRASKVPRATPGIWPARFTQAWLRANVPRISRDPSWWNALVAELTRRGWSEQEIRARVLPHSVR